MNKNNTESLRECSKEQVNEREYFVQMDILNDRIEKLDDVISVLENRLVCAFTSENKNSTIDQSAEDKEPQPNVSELTLGIIRASDKIKKQIYYIQSYIDRLEI